MVEIGAVIVISLFIFFLYDKLKTTKLRKESWIVIKQSYDTHTQLYEQQNLLTKNHIKTKIEFDDSPLVNAVKSYTSDKSDTILKLLVLEEDFHKAKEILQEGGE